VLGRPLAQVGSQVKFHVEGAATQRSVLNALEACYPMLRGTIRDHVIQQRRPPDADNGMSMTNLFLRTR
jgi:hypothetical protein